MRKKNKAAKKEKNKIDEVEAVDNNNNETDTAKEEEQPQPELTEEEKLQDRVGELEEKLIRQAAEFENYKKRTIRQFEEISNAGKEQIIIEVLEVIDNFDRSFAHENTDHDHKDFVDGIKLIFNQMTNMLDKYNVKPIEAIGQSFDPNIHEALMQIDSDEYDEGVIAMEVTKGYKMGEKIIRHSKVGVSKGKTPKETEENK